MNFCPERREKNMTIVTITGNLNRLLESVNQIQFSNTACSVYLCVHISLKISTRKQVLVNLTHDIKFIKSSRITVEQKHSIQNGK